MVLPIPDQIFPSANCCPMLFSAIQWICVKIMLLDFRFEQVQGEHSCCFKPPVVTKTKVSIWYMGIMHTNTELLLRCQREVRTNLNGHPVQTGEFVHDFSLSLLLTVKMNDFFERKLTLIDRRNEWDRHSFHYRSPPRPRRRATAPRLPRPTIFAAVLANFSKFVVIYHDITAC